MTRSNMTSSYFDVNKCAQGIKCLENVRYRWDEKLQAFQPNLLRTQFKHGYDAFAQFGHGYRHQQLPPQAKHETNELAREHRVGRTANSRQKTRNTTSWRT